MTDLPLILVRLGYLVLGVALVGASLVWTRFVSRRITASPEAAQLAEHRIWSASLLLVAAIYVAFALRPGGSDWMPIELLGVPLYSAFGVAGWRGHPRWTAVGWGLHPFWDLGVHSADTVFVPEWYRWACLSFDLVAATYLWRLSRR